MAKAKDLLGLWSLLRPFHCSSLDELRKMTGDCQEAGPGAQLSLPPAQSPYGQAKVRFFLLLCQSWLSCSPRRAVKAEIVPAIVGH